MAYSTKSYWTDKEKRAIQAREWSEKMAKQYPENIEKCVKGTKNYDDQLEFHQHRIERMPIVELVATDSVSAVFDADHENKVAVLNFASYKNPGGRFLDGSKAQEECLCHESYLYNVLKEFEDSYYKQNAQIAAETQEIENNKNIAKAEAEAKAKVIEAEGEAEANQKLEESLSDKVLKDKYIDKWNGELPNDVTDDSSIITDITGD